MTLTQARLVRARRNRTLREASKTHPRVAPASATGMPAMPMAPAGGGGGGGRKFLPLLPVLGRAELGCREWVVRPAGRLRVNRCATGSGANSSGAARCCRTPQADRSNLCRWKALRRR